MHDNTHRYFVHDRKTHALICNCGYGSLILTEFNDHLERHHQIYLQPTSNPDHLNHIVVNFLFSGVRPFNNLSTCQLCPFQTPIPKFKHSHDLYNGPPFPLPKVLNFLELCDNEYAPYKEPDSVRHNAALIKREQEIAARELREREARAHAKQLAIERLAEEQRRQDEARRRHVQELFDQRERKKAEIEDSTTNTVKLALQRSREAAKLQAAKQRADEARSSLERRDPTPDFTGYTPDPVSPSLLGAAAPKLPTHSPPRFAAMAPSPRPMRPSLPAPPPVQRATPPTLTAPSPKPAPGKTTPVPSLLDIQVVPPAPKPKQQFPVTYDTIRKGNPVQVKGCQDNYNKLVNPSKPLSPNPFRPPTVTQPPPTTVPESAQFEDAEPGPPTSSTSIKTPVLEAAPSPCDDWDNTDVSSSVFVESTNPNPSTPQSAPGPSLEDFPPLASTLHDDSAPSVSSTHSQDAFIVTKSKRAKRRDRVKSNGKDVHFKAKSELGTARVLAKDKPQSAGGDASSQSKPPKSSVLWPPADAVTRNVTQRESYVPHRPYLRHLAMDNYRKTDKPLEPIEHRRYLTSTEHKYKGHLYHSHTIPESVNAPNYLILFHDKIDIGQYYVINSKNDCLAFAHITFHPSNQSYHTPQIHKRDKDFNYFRFPIFACIEENTEAERKLFLLTMSRPLQPGRYLFHEGPIVSDSQDRGMCFFVIIEELNPMFGVYRHNPVKFRPWYAQRQEKIDAEKARQAKKMKPSDPTTSNRFDPLQ